MKEILFLCSQNSCRSQIAEAITNKYFNNKYVAYSAGVTSSKVNPYAIKVLNELDIDTNSLYSKEIADLKNKHFNIVVTVCDSLCSSCPIYTNCDSTYHIPFDDPAEFKGNEPETLNIFRQTRDSILAKLKEIL